MAEQEKGRKTVFKSDKGLLTEDHSALEVRKDGKDVILRTGDRKKTADELRKGDGSSKPLHD